MRYQVSLSYHDSIISACRQASFFDFPLSAHIIACWPLSQQCTGMALEIDSVLHALSRRWPSGPFASNCHRARPGFKLCLYLLAPHPPPPKHVYPQPCYNTMARSISPFRMIRKRKFTFRSIWIYLRFRNAHPELDVDPLFQRLFHNHTVSIITHTTKSLVLVPSRSLVSYPRKVYII